MTTFLELKTSLAADLADTAGKVFDDTALGAFINKAIAEVSRVAPQQFIEDIVIAEDQLSYPLRGGNGNLVANPSFESGDLDTVLQQASAPTLLTATAAALTYGWEVSQNSALALHFPKVSSAVSGSRVARLIPLLGTDNVQLYQFVPVNPSTVYLFSGYHWKETAGGQPSYIAIDTYDSNFVVVDSVFIHLTTAGAPQFTSGSYSVPASGVAYLRVVLGCAGVQGATQSPFLFEDISVVEQSASSLVSATAATQIEGSRVEVWDGTTTPARFVQVIPSARAASLNTSDGGWRIWGGKLYIPNWLEDQLDTAVHFIKVVGYAPYDRLATDSQVTDLSDELEFAVLKCARIEGVRRLVGSRELYTQWQTRNNNTDVTPAALMNDLSISLEDWRRTKRELVVLRER